METQSTESRAGGAWYTIAKSAAIVSGIFVLLLSTLIIVNYLQVRTIDPLNSDALTQLMQQHRQEPGNESLKEQIRALDLLARKAYFTHQWQLRIGSYLLFGSVLVFLGALKHLSSLRTSLPDLSRERSQEWAWEERILARKGLLFTGLGLFAAAFVLSVVSEEQTSPVDPTASGSAFPSAEEIRAQWPTFRGPEGNGIAYASGIPTHWDGPSGDHILWKVPVPKPGYGSPILWEGKLFLSGADQTVQEVYCYDAGSGDLLWQGQANDLPGSPPERPDVTDDTGYAAPTMATDGQRVYAVYATGDVACWDMDGTRLWGRNLGVPDNHYGHSSSLMTHRNLLLVQLDDNVGGLLLGLDARTGSQVYEVDRDVQISWASPILVNTGSRMEFILNANPLVISHDPLTGRELWRVDCMMGEVAPSPAYADGMVFVVNEYARLAAIKVSGQAEMVWEYDDNLAEVASPVATSEYLVVATSFGAVACYESKTGEELWLHDFDEGFYASPILVGELVYLMDMNGLMHIFRLGREFRQIAECPLGERAMATPAFADGRIYIRGMEHLYCVGE
ncbi:MAG: PQQ-binding-like beta-propeller repeat protein [Candidatus Latescibacteria bacterium]|nr:PQQ-binding-like beta-propeller repeat protein [Candidatus Latescibacterota bacterium]